MWRAIATTAAALTFAAVTALATVPLPAVPDGHVTWRAGEITYNVAATDPLARPAAAAAFRDVARAAGGRWTFREVPATDHADIALRWQEGTLATRNHRAAGYAVIRTTRAPWAGEHIARARVVVQAGHDAATQAHILRHELLHAVGLPHDESPESIMQPSLTAQPILSVPDHDTTELRAIVALSG